MKSLLLMAAGIAIAVICWGLCGSLLHEAQQHLGTNRLKPLIGVGVAFVAVAIVVPLVVLAGQGDLRGNWTFTGAIWSLLAGAVGALGVIGILLAMSFGGRPVYVMPMVLGGALVINTLFTIYWTRAYREGVSPVFYAGLILVIVGGATVLIFAPRAPRVTGYATPPPGHAAVSPQSDPPSSDVS